MSNPPAEHGEDAKRRAFLRALEAYTREQLGELAPGASWRTELRRVMESLYSDDSFRFWLAGYRSGAGVVVRPATAMATVTVTATVTATATVTPGPDTDIIDWTRGVVQGVIAIGGPLLAAQVLIIVWLLAMQVSPEARQQVTDLAGLVSLALALSPAFRAVAKRMDRKRDEER